MDSNIELRNKKLFNLNEEQLLAVNTYDRHLLIIAGAGTGKTMTITARISNLILQGIANPDEILAVTFTNKAANEMKNRIQKFVGVDVEKMWIGTFHSISSRIVRTFSKAINLEPNFLIIDEGDRKKLITQLIRDLNIDEKRFPVKAIQFIISSLKEKCIDPNDDEQLSNYQYKGLDIGEIYRTYQRRLRAINSLDFDDLIFECIRIFKKEPKILEDIQNRFKYITVDEYQDTNEIQHLWLRLIAGSNSNVCCVGDEDQSIYGWRGAKVEYILNFQKDFLGAKIISLKQNYRSTQQVLDTALSVISHNKQRYEKSLVSNVDIKQKPLLVIADSDREVNQHIIRTIKELNQNNIEYKDIAILVRATYQMRGIEDIFIRNNIPYQIIGGTKFYDRKEIKDIVSYIRWCYSLTDIFSLERIINIPKRGIGEKTFEDIVKYSQKLGYNIFDTLKKIIVEQRIEIESDNKISNIEDMLFNSKNELQKESIKISDKIIESLRSFVEFTKNIYNCFQNKEFSISEIIEKIYFNSGYADLLQEDIKDDPNTGSRIDNIRELISSATQFDTIEQFLEHIALVSSMDDNNTMNAVNIMTMHASKGLEFRFIFLPNWDEGSFPTQKSIEENGQSGLEEERRLAYVALTRAKENFYVYAEKQKMLFGKLQECVPSRFLLEMKNNVDILKISNNFTKQRMIVAIKNRNTEKENIKSIDYSYDDVDEKMSGYSYIQSAKNDLKKGVSKNKENYREYKKEKIKFTLQGKDSEFNIGSVVIHNTFGKGVINRIYGTCYDVKFKDTRKIVSGKDLNICEE